MEKRAICGICSAGCGVVVGLDDEGNMVSVRADDPPFGTICSVGLAGPEVVYSPHRLRHPLRRTGRKGECGPDAFERITWDEAYRMITDKLVQFRAETGPESLAVYVGSGGFELSFCDIMQPAGVRVSSASSVLFPFGCPNTMGVGALCYVSFAMIAPHVTFGEMYVDSYTDIENANMILVWGKNPASHCPPHEWHRIVEASERGATVIVIDPRKTQAAKLPGAQWIPILPGTDGALALAISQVLINEELYDENFVAEWTHGFEEFAEYVQHFRPEVVEGITGVAAQKIVDLARTLSRSAYKKRVAPVMYSGLEYSDCGVQAIRAVFCTLALAGQLDQPGGYCFHMKEGVFPLSRAGHVGNPDIRRAAGYGDFPLYTKYRGELHANALPKAVLEGDPYRIRMVISLGANIITSWPRSSVWREALGALDFLVCVDRQLTEDTRFADLVLPAATYYEYETYMVYGGAFRIREPVIAPVGEARGDVFILAELAKRLGYGHLYPQNGEELLERALRGSGFTLDDVRSAGGMVSVERVPKQYKLWETGGLRADGRPGFSTPTGKFEFRSATLEEYGYRGIPEFVDPKSEPTRDLPLTMTTGSRSSVDLHGLHRIVPTLGKEKPVPTVMMNSRDADERGIRNGEPVRLITPQGQVALHALVTDDVMPGVVDANAMGGGPLGPEEWQVGNINEVTDLRFDPISGFPVYRQGTCQIVRRGTQSKEVGGRGEYQLPEVSVAKRKRVYLDNNATTAVDPEVRDVMLPFLEEEWGNPSSIHSLGTTAAEAISKARQRVAQAIHCTPPRVVFTASGTEADNLALFGVPEGRLITSQIEHPAVLRACEELARRGREVVYLPVNSEGVVEPASLEEALSAGTALVSVMHVNNETGAIQPIEELARLAHDHGALFHTDAVQALGKIPVDVEALGVDMMSLSAHKIHGPKGVGALYVRKGVDLTPLVFGGGQERGLRSGTENVTGIVGFGKACELVIQRVSRMSAISAMRDELQAGILDLFPEAIVNGSRRTANTLCVTFPGIRGESLVYMMDRKGICFSSGSACKSGKGDASHVLRAMGLSEEQAHCSVRLSLGIQTKPEEIDYVLMSLGETLKENGEAVRFVSCR